MKASRKRLGSLVAAIGLLLPVPAVAHHAMGGETPRTFVQGLLSGLAHPVIGIDHFLFLLSAGFLAYGLRSRSRFLTPAAFVLGGFFGTCLDRAGFGMPLAEVLTALSVIVGGALVLRTRPLSGPAIGLFFGVAGVVHGYAYAESIIGAELPPYAAYLLGLAAIQYVVMAGMVMALTKQVGLGERGYVTVARRITAASALVGGAVFLALGWLA